jgi:hypothetical protein
VSQFISLVGEKQALIMNSRTDTIEFRGWVTLGFCFAALALPRVLTSVGIADFDSERSEADPYRPADRSFGNRICLVAEWMWPACLLTWACAQFRVRQAVMFSKNMGYWTPLVVGVAGLVIQVVGWLQWNARSFSGHYFGAFDGWLFGLGWFLLSWSFVFWRRKIY